MAVFNETLEFIEGEIAIIKSNIDMMFLVVTGIIIFGKKKNTQIFILRFLNHLSSTFKNQALQPAFGFFEMGMVRHKNVVSVAFRKYISIGKCISFFNY